MTRALFLLSALVGLMTVGVAWAGYDDGSHSISVDGDWGTNGLIKLTNETGAGGVTDDYTFRMTTDQDLGAQIDALSSGQHPWATVGDMFSYTNIVLLYSIQGSTSAVDDDDSALYWVKVTGQLTSPVNPGARNIHDTAADLGLADDAANSLYYDLDGVESHQHRTSFPDHGDNPAYYSVAGGSDIYAGTNWDSVNNKYLDNTLVMSAASLGLAPGEDLEDLILFNEFYADPILGPSNQWAFYTLLPGTTDPVGDNVYVSGGSGSNALWYDPQDDHNWDALDVVPEPGTMSLMGFGLAGLALVRRRRKS